MKKIIIISNLRMLLIYLLIENKLDQINENLYIVDDSLSIIKKDINKIFVSKAKNIIDLMIKSLKYYFKFSRLPLKEVCRVYGADHIMGAKFFLKRFSFFLIEDGVRNYHFHAYERSFKNKLFSTPSFGLYRNVKKIFLSQKTQNLPKEILDKVEFFDIHSLWNGKTEEEKLLILSFFNIDKDKLQNLNEKKYILYTQPLSEDGIISEYEKVKMYQNIIANYSIHDLVIKPHPREVTDYNLFFLKAMLFDKDYPSEILELLDIKFEKAITLFSTAILQYPKEKIDFYGMYNNPKLLSKFGNIQLTDIYV
ncbi:glycosyl transferase family 52 [Cricetibacter osteomyelitidis]|uniref:Glycosyl transferase family 52 n=1 Tax=Cricetibacter osteomyelitidis TaxID=1521931 RepID=A0A4R2T0D3_9PAST|nr:glycosyltransferase family 52 [Cricetibacter osteomyelitidis]TCP95520.1 glycosyl transferase family 52 [Cricetibacter osteomyelitidis]